MTVRLNEMKHLLAASGARIDSQWLGQKMLHFIQHDRIRPVQEVYFDFFQKASFDQKPPERWGWDETGATGAA